MRLNEVGKIAKAQWFQLMDRFPNISLGEFTIMPNHLHAILWIMDLKSVGAGLAPTQDGNDLVPTDGHPRGALLRIVENDNGIGAWLAPARDGNDLLHADGHPRGALLRIVENDNGIGAGLAPAQDGNDLVHADGHPRGAPLRIVENDNGIGAGLAPAQDGNDLVSTDGHPRGAPLRSITLGEIIGAYKSLVVNECLKVYKARNKQMGKLWQRNYYEHIIRDEEDYQRIADYIQNNPQRWELDSLFPSQNG